MAEPIEELTKSYKPVSDMKCEASETDYLRKVPDYAEPSVTAKNTGTPQDPQNDSTGTEIKLQEDLTATSVRPKVTTEDSTTREQSATLSHKSMRYNRTPRRRPRHSKKLNKPESNLHHKPMLIAIPDESNDIQMTDNTEMPFLLAPVNEQEYQEMLNSIDYRLIHSTVPSHIHDIAITKESDTFPADNDWLIMDEITPPEPVACGGATQSPRWRRNVGT